MPDIRVPEIKTIKLTVAQIKSMPDEKLLEVLNGKFSNDGIVTLPLQQIIIAELTRRNMERSSKPHWSVIPSFILLIAAVVISILAYLQGVESVQKQHQEKNNVQESTKATQPVNKNLIQANP